MNAKNKTLVEVMEFHGSQVAFEEINGKMMVNATQMAKPFGKTPKDWLRTLQAKDLVKVVAARQKCLPTDLQLVRNGGTNFGTYLEKNVALFFAQWLSPEFYLACNEKLEELLTKQILQVSPKHGVYPIIENGQYIYPYTDVLRALGGSTKSSKRKAKFPQHFTLKFGRNFISDAYFDLLKNYYSYKSSCRQLRLSL